MGNKTVYELIRVIDSNGLYAELNASRCLCIGVGDKQLAAREATEGDCSARYRRIHGGASALSVERIVSDGNADMNFARIPKSQELAQINAFIMSADPPTLPTTGLLFCGLLLQR